MHSILRRTFTVPVRNALHVYPTLKPVIKNSPFKQIEGLDLPLMERIERKHSIKTRPSISQFDDRNSANHLKLTLAPDAPDLTRKLQQEYDSTERKHPFILGDKPKPVFRTLTYTTDTIQSSVKKSIPVINALIGRHFYDSIFAGYATEKKVGKFLSEQMDKYMMDKIKEAGFDPKFMFITSIVVNRKLRVRKLRYHARGRGFTSHRDHSIFKITVSEKPIQEFYRMMIEGKTPAYITYLIREYLTQKQADFEEVRQLQMFLTARGRQQQRLMFKRKVLAKWLEYKKAGRFVRIRIVKDMVMEQEVKIFEEKFRHFFKLPGEVKEERMAQRRKQLDKLNIG